jgi:lipopolysaccharide heptosyltransferase II
MLRKIIVRVGSGLRNALPARKLDERAVRKICVFKIGAIGDVLMSTPMLHALRQHFTRARIEYWTGKWSAPVLEKNEDLNRVIAFDDAAFHGRRADLILRLARAIALQRYDLMLILDKHWSLGVFGRMCGIPVRIGFDREGEGFAHTLAVPYGPVKHEVDYYLDLAYAIGAKRILRPRLELALSSADRQFAERFFKQHRLVSRRTIAISPGGAKNPGQNMPVRRWPVGRFVEVAQALSRDGWQLLIIGKAPGDSDTVQPITAAAPHAVSAVGDFTLKQSAALLRLCRLLVCNDAGQMHVAAAVGTPTVSVFGATDPKRKAPRGSKHLWVWNPVDCTRAEVFAKYDEPQLTENILKITPAHVLKAVRQLVK